jgi:hypothetical protein
MRHFEDAAGNRNATPRPWVAKDDGPVLAARLLEWGRDKRRYMEQYLELQTIMMHSMDSTLRTRFIQVYRQQVDACRDSWDSFRLFNLIKGFATDTAQKSHQVLRKNLRTPVNAVTRQQLLPSAGSLLRCRRGNPTHRELINQLSHCLV